MEEDRRDRAREPAGEWVEAEARAVEWAEAEEEEWAQAEAPAQVAAWDAEAVLPQAPEDTVFALNAEQGPRIRWERPATIRCAQNAAQP